MTFVLTTQYDFGPIPKGTRVQAWRRPDRDIVLRAENGDETVLSAAEWCLMGESVEASLPWLEAAVKDLSALTGRTPEVVLSELRDTMYRLQVNAGPARNHHPWSFKDAKRAVFYQTMDQLFSVMTALEDMKAKL